ncbi:hypothetical protein Tco_0599515 [Tanacetum coccineum]
MANQEQNPPQQEQPFVAAKQVGFNLEDILLNTNNEVALLYPEHNNKDYFKCVSDFISKCCLRKPFTRSPNMYKEYLAEFWYSTKALENSKVFFSIPTGGIFGEVGVNTFRNAIGAHYLPHSSEYVAPPSIDVVRQWFLTIGYGEEVSAKGTLRKSLLPPRWRLLMAQIIQCLGGKTGGFDQITNKDAIILYSLANGINIDYANIFWEDIIIKLKKKQREKVVPYTRFLSLLIMHKMKEGYGDDEKCQRILFRVSITGLHPWNDMIMRLSQAAVSVASLLSVPLCIQALRERSNLFLSRCAVAGEISCMQAVQSLESKAVVAFGGPYEEHIFVDPHIWFSSDEDEDVDLCLAIQFDHGMSMTSML